MDEILKYLLPILGIAFGATMQYVFSQKNESRKQRELLKANAYSDYLKAIAGVSISQRNNNVNKQQEFTIQVADAKARISIYGSSNVVMKLAEFERVDPTLSTLDSRKVLLSAISEMRLDTLKKSDVKIEDISMLIIGKEDK